MILSGRELEKPTVSDLLALEQKKTEEQTAEAENATA